MDTPKKKNTEAPVQLEQRTPGLRVKHFTTEPRRTLPAFVHDDLDDNWLASLTQIKNIYRSGDWERYNSQRRWSMQTMLNPETTGPWLLPQNSIEIDTIQYLKT